MTGKLTDDWSMIGSYGYTDARLINDPDVGNAKLLNAAMNTASLYLVYDFGDRLARTSAARRRRALCR